MNRKKRGCPKCHNLFSSHNINRHIKSCDGAYTKWKKKFKSSPIICAICGNWTTDTSLTCHVIEMHLRGNNENYPLRVGRYKKGRIAWNKGLSKDTSSIIASYGRKISESQKGRLMSEEQKNLMSKIAKSRGLGGYRPGAGRGKRHCVSDSFGTIVTLQSSYELTLSEILNSLGIKWIRPKPFAYDDGRKYYPDFYLVDYDLYLDPKNSYLAEIDSEKIHKVCQQNSVRVVVLSKDQLTKEFILSLLST